MDDGRWEMGVRINLPPPAFSLFSLSQVTDSISGWVSHESLYVCIRTYHDRNTIFIKRKNHVRDIVINDSMLFANIELLQSYTHI